MPTALSTVRPDLFGERHTLWIPLPRGADLERARGKFDLDTTSIVEFVDVSDGSHLMAVSVFTEGGPLAGDDAGALYGEAAEAWCRATMGSMPASSNAVRTRACRSSSMWPPSE